MLIFQGDLYEAWLTNTIAALEPDSALVIDNGICYINGVSLSLCHIVDIFKIDIIWIQLNFARCTCKVNYSVILTHLM